MTGPNHRDELHILDLSVIKGGCLLGERLALHGGTPAVAERPVSTPFFSGGAKQRVLEIIESGDLARFYGGRYVRRFESEFAGWFGRRHGVAVNSGTSALHLAFLAAGLPRHAEVLVPANAYVSAVSALIQCDLVPIFVDIEPATWSMDPADAARKITPRTAGLLAVHMLGQPCPMAELAALAETRGLVLLEDCAQAHGAIASGRIVGSFGLAASFSLCCRKHLTVGEGGMVITDAEAFAETARSAAHKGKGDGWFDYRFLGFSYGMTEIQAVLGLDALSGLADELQLRRRCGSWLEATLRPTGLVFASTPAGSLHSYYKCAFLLPEGLADRRQEYVDALRAENVNADLSHPSLLRIGWIQHKKPELFRSLGHQPDYDPRSCPVADDVLPRQICLELGHGIGLREAEGVGAAVGKVTDWFCSR